MKWEFTKNCRYKLRIVLLTYTLLTLIPAKCKSQVKITLGRQTTGRELPSLLISEKKKQILFTTGEGRESESFFLHDFPSLLSEEEDAAWRESDCYERLLSGPVFFYGGPQLSRQNQKPHGKTENLKAKPKTSRQNQILQSKNQIPHGKSKYPRQNQSYFAFAVISIWFCREVLVLP